MNKNKQCNLLSQESILWMAQVSHELKTPLNSVIGILSLLEETELNNEQFEYIDMIKKSSNQLLNLIKHILDYAKLHSKHIELKEDKNRFRKIIDEVCQSFSYKIIEKKLKFNVNYDEKIPTYVFCDRLRIIQILNNLISNAIKFTSFGSITINVSLKSIHNNICNLHFQISDTGIGIPKDKIKSLFKPFHQCHRNGSNIGTGLGLSICKKLCELMNGHLNITSSQNGTIVSFNLKLKVNKINNIKTNILKDKNFLIIDSNPSKRLNLASILFEYNCKVLALNNIYDVHEYIQQGYIFDLVMIEISQFNQQFRNIFPNTMNYLLLCPIENSIKEYEDFNIHYLIKPINEKKVVDILLSIFGKMVCNQSYSTFNENPSKFKLLSQNRNIHILIVDDVIDNQIVLFKILQKFGYKNIDICNNGKECLEILKKKKY